MIMNNGISAKDAMRRSRAFVSGMSVRCHLSGDNAQCIGLFRSGGCRDILRNRVVRANINVILHGGVDRLNRLFVFGSGGGG